MQKFGQFVAKIQAIGVVGKESHQACSPYVETVLNRQNETKRQKYVIS